MNYQIEMENIINNLSYKPKLLLHACCAPCASYVLEYLSKYFEITILFYNPNIDTKKEFDYRYNELKRLVKEMNLEVDIVEPNYNKQEFIKHINGLENEKEGGKRCIKCFNLRLDKTAEIASLMDFDYFATTLTISPLKNADQINKIGFGLAKKYNTKYLPSDFKKKEGYKRSIELSNKYNLYRQDYCGCKFSKSST